MNKLLNAGFARLRKSKLFWLLITFIIVLAIFMIYMSCRNLKEYGIGIPTEQTMLNYSEMAGIVIAIFTSLFLGTEYSDGAIRNKISTGHKRSDIYLANLIITSVTSILTYVLFAITAAIIGIPLLGGITMPVPRLLAFLGCILLVLIVYSGIFTFIAMMISNKAISCAVSIMMAFGMMIAALTCFGVLSEPEEILVSTMTDSESGEIDWLYEPNPKYPSEQKKQVCKVLLDINPSGQTFQVAGISSPDLKVLPLYSAGELILFVVAGILLFKRKELK